MTHTFITPDAPLALYDPSTGEHHIPVAALLAFVHQLDPAMTEPDLIERMEAVGWRWQRTTATGPHGDTITVSVLTGRVPR